MKTSLNQLPLIAIVGRANVGKSTIFNLIAKREIALVADRAGVTRDRNYVVLNNYLYPFCLVDTGGIMGEENATLADAVATQTRMAINEADLIIAVLDAKNGLHQHDYELASLLRNSKKPVIWVANKSEKAESKLNVTEFYSLGIDEIHEISAAHNEGVRELVKKVWKLLGREDQMEVRVNRQRSDIRVAILGKPNAGKSTFLNKVIGEDRAITSDIAGTTRDTLRIPLVRDGQEYLLIDTAGLRKKKNIKDESLEQLFSFKSLRAIAECDVAVLVVDSTQGIPTDQEAKLASMICERGKGLIIVANKWDAVEKDHRSAKEYETALREKLSFCTFAPVLFISALTGKRCPSVLTMAKTVFESGKKRIPTAELNKIFESAFSKNTPPVFRGRPVKFYFGTQIAGNPPTIIAFVNQPTKISTSYLRYLKNYLRAKHPFIGYDLLIIPRKRADKSKDD